LVSPGWIDASYAVPVADKTSMSPFKRSHAMKSKRCLLSAGLTVTVIGLGSARDVRSADCPDSSPDNVSQLPDVPGKPVRMETSGFRVPSTVSKALGNVILLAIDDHLLPLKKDLCYYLSKPKVRTEPVLAPSRNDPKAPDHLAAHFYGTVLRDQGRFRMWYYPVSLGAKPTDLRQGPICYAESNDGIRWTKPNLGQVEFRGSKDNNAIKLPDKSTQCAAVIKDESDPDPRRRYKMVYTAAHEKGIWWAFRTATSSDGVHWTARADSPVPSFLEMGSFYRHGDLYVVHGQGAGYSEGGHQHGRRGYASVSPDFNRWVPGFVEAFALPEPAEEAVRGGVGPYDQVHLGVGAASLGSVAVGLYGLWHNPPADKRNKKGWYGAGLISCDLGLLISNDGMHFREPVKGHVFISSSESPAPPLDGKRWPTILCQANGILNVGDETRIYHGRWRNGPDLFCSDYYGEVAVATLVRDRWGALGLGPGKSEGFVCSAPITLPDAGYRIFLNANHAQLMRVEVSDARFNLLPEHSGSRFGIVRAEGGLDCAVAWPAGDLSALGGKTVRFKIHLRKEATSDPRLYAVYLR